MARKLHRLSQTLGSMLKARGLESRLSEYRILGQWEKAVGAVIARHAQPVALRGRKLFLAVDSPAWMQQLSLLKPEIIEKLNRRLGREAIVDITLRIGEITHTVRQPDEGPVLKPLERADLEKIEQYVREIRDPGIRDAVRRVMEKDFQSKKGRK